MNLWRWTQCVYRIGEKHTKAKKAKTGGDKKVEVYSIGQCMDTQNNRWSLKTLKGRTPKWYTKMFSGRQNTPNKVSKNTDLLQGISQNEAVVWIAERSQYQKNRFVTPNSYIKKRISKRKKEKKTLYKSLLQFFAFIVVSSEWQIFIVSLSFFVFAN